MLALAKQYITRSSVIWGLLFFSAVFLTLNKNSKSESGIGNYQSEFWADKGGYYIYLPWAINSGFDANRLPENIADSCGNSFEIINNKVASKYMIGVAILQSPFYMIGHAQAFIMYDEPTGFEKVYANWIGVGSVFYLILGLYFSFRLIRDLFGRYIGIVAVVLILTGSNLLYYGIDETMMAHVYGFSLISLLNWLIIGNNVKAKRNLILVVIIALLFLLRPTNIAYVILLILIFRKELEFPSFSKLNLLYFFISFLLISCQVSYWYITFNSFTPGGYANEGFSNWLSPNFILILFSPNNGWLPYSLPFGLVLFTSLFFMKRMSNKKIVTLTFMTLLSMIYVSASWWTYDFGCGMGARTLIDFSSVWMLFTGVFFNAIQGNHNLKYGLSFLLALLCLLNVNMTYNYDNCYFGLGDWDWGFYLNKLLP